MISDVPGDDPAVIASGPTVPDPTTFADALAVLQHYGIDEPAAAVSHIHAGASGDNDAPRETPKPADPSFASDEHIMLATARDAQAAAAAHARAAGVAPVLLGDDLEERRETWAPPTPLWLSPAPMAAETPCSL